MLGWLARSYSEAHLVLVIRDPVDVARSQLRGGWQVELERFTNQPDLIADYPILQSDLITDIKDQFELNVLHWAIENRVALDQLTTARSRGAKVKAFAYHALRDDPEQFRAFLTFCGAPADESVVRHMNRPSRVSHAVPLALPPSEAERAFALSVAKAFSLTEYLSPSAIDKLQPAAPFPAPNGPS